MRKSFSWRHGVAIVAALCLMSIVAGAVMAQNGQELDPVEPDASASVPSFDLTELGDAAAVSVFPIEASSLAPQALSPTFKITPNLSSTVISTTPLVTWAENDPTVSWYRLLAAAYDPLDNNKFAVSWDQYYPTKNVSGAEGICDTNGLCQVRPNTDLTFGLAQYAGVSTAPVILGDARVDLYMLAFGPAPNYTLLTNLSTLAPFTSFPIKAPSVTIDVNGGPNPTVPGASVNRVGQGVKQYQPASVVTLPMTTTIYHDFYRIAAVQSGQITFDSWYRVKSPASTTVPCVDGSSKVIPCVLEQVDNKYFIQGGQMAFYVQGYNSTLNAFSPWASAGSHTIPTVAPPANSIVVAGLYEDIGGNPLSLTSTWTPCATSGSSVTCKSSQPYVHIALDQNGGFSGNWIQIISIKNSQTITSNTWFERNGQNKFPLLPANDTSSLQCGSNYGGLGLTTTCFFRPSSQIRLEKGAQYGLWLRGYTTSLNNQLSGFVNQNFNIAPSSEATGVKVSTVFALTGTFPDSSAPSFTNTLITNAPVISWDEIPQAEWVLLRISNPANQLIWQGEIQGWVSTKDPRIRCQGGVCRFFDTSTSGPILTNGAYFLSFGYYDGDVSSNAVTPFNISSPGPQPPALDKMVVSNNENLVGTLIPDFEWPHSQGNNWYELSITDATNTKVLYNKFFWANNICRRVRKLAGTMYVNQVLCKVDGLSAGIFTTAGDFSWAVGAYAGNNTNATSGRATFNVSNVPTGGSSVSAVWPLTTSTTLTATNIPTFAFTPADNANWYEVYIGLPGSNNTYETIFHSFVNKSAAKDCQPGQTYGTLDNGSGQVMRTTTVPTCLMPYAPNGPLFSGYNQQLWRNGTYEWWLNPLGPTTSSANWKKVSTFEVSVPKSDPVDHTKVMVNGTVIGSGGVTALSQLTNVQWTPVHLRFGGQPWLYQVEIWDSAATGVAFKGPLYSDFIGAGQFKDQFGNGSCGNTVCRANIPSSVNASFSPYGVYEVRIGAFGQGNKFTTNPLFIQWSYPADGDPQTAKFTKL